MWYAESTEADQAAEPKSYARIKGLSLGAFILYQFVLTLATNAVFFQAALDRCTEFPTSQADIVILLVWSSAMALIWWSLKFSPRKGACYFFWATGFWGLPWLGRADTPEEIASSNISHRVFYVCLTALVIGIIRVLLGEGREQTKTLKRIVGLEEPNSATGALPAQESLLRASAPPPSAPDTLLRPAGHTIEPAPEQLLRPGQPTDN